jgi:xyloglucan fucosyltransferase
MDKKKFIKSYLSPGRGLEARRRWWCRPAARPTVLVITVGLVAALLMAVVLFGVRLTPSGGGSNSWVSAGVRDVLKAGTYAPNAACCS